MISLRGSLNIRYLPEIKRESGYKESPWLRGRAFHSFDWIMHFGGYVFACEVGKKS